MSHVPRELSIINYQLIKDFAPSGRRWCGCEVSQGVASLCHWAWWILPLRGAAHGGYELRGNADWGFFVIHTDIQ